MYRITVPIAWLGVSVKNRWPTAGLHFGTRGLFQSTPATTTAKWSEAFSSQDPVIIQKARDLSKAEIQLRADFLKAMAMCETDRTDVQRRCLSAGETARALDIEQISQLSERSYIRSSSSKIGYACHDLAIVMLQARSEANHTWASEMLALDVDAVVQVIQSTADQALHAAETEQYYTEKWGAPRAGACLKTLEGFKVVKATNASVAILGAAKPVETPEPEVTDPSDPPEWEDEPDWNQWWTYDADPESENDLYPIWEVEAPMGRHKPPQRGTRRYGGPYVARTEDVPVYTFQEYWDDAFSDPNSAESQWCAHATSASAIIWYVSGVDSRIRLRQATELSADSWNLCRVCLFAGGLL